MLALQMFFELFPPHSVALTVLILSLVAAAGLALGSIRIFGITLGIGGVLFSGLLFGRLLGEQKLDEDVIHFCREFGLILFVYTIGVQVGPGFLASLRKEGLPLNLMAAGIVILGVAVTIAVSKLAGIDMISAVGLMSGAVTNTPSLGAAQQAIKDATGAVQTPDTVSAYAIAYPFGILGIILTMIGLREVFRISVAREGEAMAKQQESTRPSLATMNIEVVNPNLDGEPLERIPVLDDGNVVVSRVFQGGKVVVASPETILHRGDVLLAVGTEEELDDLRIVVGQKSTLDLRSMPSHITTRRILVTQRAVLGKTVDELELPARHGVTITRIRRGEIEISPTPDLRLQFGDTVVAVGEEEDIREVARLLGDSLKRLNHPMIIPVFVGIALGVILGSLPVSIRGMSATVKLGLAGGPLIVAIVLSRLGHFGPLIWYMPQSANFILREVGIVLFLACVGVNSGHEFFDKVASGEGLTWLACGALITAVPLLAVGLFARLVMKANYMSICGLLAGSMTDPPALAFAGSVTGSDAPSVAYAAVYPLVMLLRVLFAQILVLAFV